MKLAGRAEHQRNGERNVLCHQKNKRKRAKEWERKKTGNHIIYMQTKDNRFGLIFDDSRIR